MKTPEKVFGVYRNLVRGIAAAVLPALLLGAAAGVVRHGGAEWILRRALLGKEACLSQVPAVPGKTSPGSEPSEEKSRAESAEESKEGRKSPAPTECVECSEVALKEKNKKHIYKIYRKVWSLP